MLPTASAAPVAACGVGGVYCIEVEVADAALACVREGDAWTCTWTGMLRGAGSTEALLPGQARLGGNAYVAMTVCGDLGCAESYAFPAASCAWAAGEGGCAFEHAFARAVTLPAGPDGECLWADGYAFSGPASARPPGSPVGFASAVDQASRTFTSGVCG